MSYLFTFIAGAWLGMAIMSLLIISRDSDE